MKKMRKLLAVLMTLAMVMGLGMTSFAAEGKKVTVEKLPAGATVTYAQIVKEDRESVLGWQFVEKYEETFVKAYLNKTELAEGDADSVISALIALGKLENINNATVAAGAINSSEAFGRALSAVKNMLDKEATVSGTNAAFEANAIGLYAIKNEKTGYTFITMAVYVGTDYTSSRFAAKGSQDVVSKVIDAPDDESVSAGDEVAYTATTNYPFYSAEEKATFWVEDTLTNATFKAGSLEVYVEGVAEKLAEGTAYTVNNYAGTKNLKVTFVYNPAYAGKEVTIKYVAVVGEGEGDVNNTIKSNFDASGDSVTLDKVAVAITKVDASNAQTKLASATFEIYEAVAEAKDGYTTVENAKVNGSEGTTTLYLKKFAEGTTDVNGVVNFVGLDAQKTYYIKETVAPEGYSLNDNYYLLVGATEKTESNDVVYAFNDFDSVTVTDTKLNALPSTGGIGTTIFTIGGCAIMVAAAYMFFASRRREDEQ